MRLFHLCIFVGIATLVLCISQILLEVYLNDEDTRPISSIYTYESLTHIYEEVTDPVIVWWAPLSGISNFGRLRQCGQVSCFFTDLRQFRQHPHFEGFMFYGSNLNLTDLPLPRNGSSVFWALLHEESPRNNIPIAHKAIISLFNYTATFSRHSSFPLTTQYLWDIAALTDGSLAIENKLTVSGRSFGWPPSGHCYPEDILVRPLLELRASPYTHWIYEDETIVDDMKYFEETETKTNYQNNERLLAPVVYIQSDCSTTNNRDSYVSELSKHIRVDSYGACLHNRNLPPHLQTPFGLATMMSDDLLHIVAKYKFMLAIENGICEDYITEKLWRPLIAGTVPIYIGSPSVADWLPNNSSAILGLDFESPKHLAEYLHHLNTHDEEYNKYLSHKLESKVTNTRLIQVLKERKWGEERSVNRDDNFIDSFECFVCQKAHKSDQMSIATLDHYSCPIPVSILSGEWNITNFWLDSWFSGHCEAEAVRNFIDSGISNFTIEEYNNALSDLKSENKCSFSVNNAKNLYLERLEI